MGFAASLMTTSCVYMLAVPVPLESVITHSTCLYVMARKQPRLHCDGVEIAPLFRREKHRGAPAVRLDTDSNVSVCPMMHRHCPAGIFFKVLSRNVERVRPFRLWLQ